MIQKFIGFLKIVLPLILAVVLVYFAFSKVELKDFVEKSGQANYWWVFFSIVLSLFGYVIRAYRWNLMLSPMGYKMTTFRTTLAVLVGYLANLAFPRLGEITRCGMLRRTDDVPVTISLGSVISERLIDALTLLGLLGFSFLIEYDLISSFLSESLAEYNISFGKLMIAGGVIAVISIAVVLLFLSKSNARTSKLREWFRELYAGVISVSKMNNLPAFVVSTILLWVVYYLMSYLIVFSMEETSFLSITAGFMLLVTGGIAISLPVQGGIGTYHTMVTGLLMLYGIDRTTGLFLATLLHTSQILAIIIFGGLALFATVVISRKKKVEVSAG